MRTAPTVPYRSPRALRGSSRLNTRALSGLAGSSKKRNWDAFNSTYPGTSVNPSGNYVLPAKFGGVVINQGQLDDLSGTWYGAVYHPDGDQAGWQQKFDAVLKAIGAFNSFYGVAPTTVAVTPTPTPAPTPTPTPLPPPTNTNLPASVTLSQQIGFTTDGLPVFQGSDGNRYVMSNGQLMVYTGQVMSAPPSQTVPVPTTVPADQTGALIQQLMAQGASQQQAFAAALQSLASQGIQATPQVQQQVASDIASAGQPQQASVIYLGLGAAALILIGILGSRRNEKKR